MHIRAEKADIRFFLHKLLRSMCIVYENFILCLIDNTFSYHVLHGSLWRPNTMEK